MYFATQITLRQVFLQKKVKKVPEIFFLSLKTCLKLIWSILKLVAARYGDRKKRVILYWLHISNTMTMRL